MKELKDIFSTNLNSLMNRNGENVRILSDSLAVPFSTVSDWKHGKKMPRSGSLQKIADHYNVNISYLTNDNSNNNDDISSIYSRLNEKNKEMIIRLIKRILDNQMTKDISNDVSSINKVIEDEFKDIFEEIDSNIKHLTSNDKEVIKSLANTYLSHKTKICLDFE